jgi:hypothetical protein
MFGQLHSKYVENTPLILRNKGAIEEASFVERYMEQFKSSVKSPDDDYQEFSFLHEFLPESVKDFVPRTSPIKFEHVLVDDVPKVLEEMLIKLCDRIGAKYRYADVALVDWYEQAKSSMKTGLELDFVRHIGRCCHIIQDTCVPMHCRVIGNIKDIFDVFKHKDPNHNKFEAFCGDTYDLEEILKIDFSLDALYEIPSALQETAKKSREYVEMCDGIKFSIFWFRILKLLGLAKVNEDYKKAADYANSMAQINTVRFLYKAIKECR